MGDGCGECEDARGGGEGVRGEGEEISERVEITERSIRHQPNDVGGACQSNNIHHQRHSKIYQIQYQFNSFPPNIEDSPYQSSIHMC